MKDARTLYTLRMTMSQAISGPVELTRTSDRKLQLLDSWMLDINCNCKDRKESKYPEHIRVVLDSGYEE